MYLTGPLFLLIFLPLSVLFVLPLRRHRAAALAILSAVWYVLANLQNPFGILHIFLLVGMAVLFSCLPQKKAVAAFGIVLTVAGWLTARIFAEYAGGDYLYPAGLTVVSMGVISLLADRTAEETTAHSTPAEKISYLLFYPTIMLGPVIRFSQYLDLCRNANVTVERFSHGIHVFVAGYIKRLTVAAILYRTLETVFSYNIEEISPLTIVFILPMSFFFLYFFLTGTTSLARGVALMYGMELPRDHRPLFGALFPDEMFAGMFLSLNAFLATYVRQPLRKHIPGRAGRLLAVLVSFVLTVFFFRLKPGLLLLGLPLLLFSLWKALPVTPPRLPGNLFAKIAAGFGSALCSALFATGLILPDPLRFFDFFKGGFSSGNAYQFYYIYGTVPGSRYLLLGALAVIAFIPLSHLHYRLQNRLADKKLLIFRISESCLLFVGFFLTLLYFMPQFPEYADRVLSRLFI